MRSITRRIHAPLLGLTLLSFTACTMVPTRPIPEPLPEVLAWTQAQPVPTVFFGVEVRENDSGSLDDLFFAPGVRVVTVADGSPAAQVGMRAGDVVLQLAGEEINDPDSFEVLLALQVPDSALILQVQRGDAIFEIEAVILASHPEGPLAKSGIPNGAIVTHLDGAPVRSERALVRKVLVKEPGTDVLMTWHMPSNKSQETHVTLYAPDNRLLEATLPVVIGYISSADGESSTLYVGDLWLIWLFKYQREGREHHYSFLRFITWSTNEGLLGSEQ